MNQLVFILLMFSGAILTSSCQDGTESNNPSVSDNQANVELPDLPLDKINLPDGFSISIYAEVPNARSLAKGANGTIFVGNRYENKVYALRDEDNDGVAEKRYVIAEGLRSPNGVAFSDGDLFVGDISKILIYRDIENNLENPPAGEVIVDNYPTDGHHGWKYIAFGPDGKLYVPVGAPCNICENLDKPIYASITSINRDGTGREIVAHGVRNTVGFTWHPETKEMWFTDNGRDMLGDNTPPCELNRLSENGQHFGYPYCHGGTISDPEFGGKRDCNEFIEPVQNLGPHVAPLGLKFVTESTWPSEFQNAVVIAEHGSWNRSEKIGYRLSLVRTTGNESQGYEVFADGWLNDRTQEIWGRPVDVLFLDDGSMLVSDDYANVIYRITYEG